MTMISFSTLPLLAGAAGDWDGGGWWVLWPLFWIGVLATIGWLVYRRRRSHPHDSARQILAERFARGELSGDEYRQRLAEL
jgi:putative membrane protein